LSVNTLSDANLRCQFQYLNELLFLFYRPQNPCFVVTHSLSGCKYTTLFYSHNTF
jgi:hypothetical protein